MQVPLETGPGGLVPALGVSEKAKNAALPLRLEPKWLRAKMARDNYGFALYFFCFYSFLFNDRLGILSFNSAVSSDQSMRIPKPWPTERRPGREGRDRDSQPSDPGL